MRLIPFRRLLTISLVALVTVSVALVAAVFEWNKRSNVQQLLKGQLEILSLYFDSSVGKLLDVASEQTRLMVGLFDAKTLRPDDAQTLTRYWIETLKVHPRITYLSIGRESDGAYLHVARLSSGRFSIRQLLPDPTTGQLALKDFWPEDFPDKPYFEKKDHQEGDPRTRPYYLAAKQGKRSLWTEAYPFMGVDGQEDTIGITFATPFFGDNEDLIGVLSVDFDLASVSKLLLEEPTEGYLFILEQGSDGSRTIVAHPDPAVALTDVARRIGAAGGSFSKEVDDPVADRFRDLIVESGTEKAIEPQQIVRFDVTGTSYLGTYFGLGRSLGLRWSICYVTPMAFAMSLINVYNFIAAVVTLLSLAVAIRVGFWLSRKVSAPLSALTEEAIRIGAGRFDSDPKRNSTIREVNQLIQAAEDMKAGLRSFEKYAPRDVVRELVALGKEATLGGERREITVSFADMVSFTSLSEVLCPEDLVRLLEKFHTVLADAVSSTGGVIDKLIGDAAMALWGAPKADTDHAWNACIAALRARDRFQEMGADLTKTGLPALDCRIGIQTGEAIVGNMGTDSRMDYTAIGDTVNVASRLEGLNKVYGARILIGEGTYLAIENRIVTRPVDRIAVKGKQRGGLVYELVGLPGEVDESVLEGLKRYGEGLEAYFRMDWQAAIRLFESALERLPEDGPSLLMIARCRAFAGAPPMTNWDGVYRPDQK